MIFSRPNLRRAAFLLCAVLVLALGSASRAEANDRWGNPDLGADGYYAALANYVNWLQARKGQGAVTGAQKQGFRDTLADLNQQALWEMGVRDSVRKGNGWTWNRAALAGAVDQLTNALNADNAGIVDQYNRDVAGAAAERDAQLSDLAKQYQQDKAEILREMKEEADADSKGDGESEEQSENGRQKGRNSSSDQGHGTKVCHQARRAARKARSRFGKHSQKARKATRRVQKLCSTQTTGSPIASVAAADLSDYKEQLADLEQQYAEDRADVQKQFQEDVQAAAEERDANLADRRAQYDADVASANDDANDAWANELGEIQGALDYERAVCTDTRDRGLDIIASMPQR